MSSGGLYQRTWLDAALALPDDRYVPDRAAGEPATLPARYLPAREYGGPQRCEVIPYLGPAIAAAGLTVAAPVPGPARPGAARVRVWRIPRDADDAELGPCWSWRCDTCDRHGNGCLHPVLHTPGSWAAAFCGGFQHIHCRHPRPGVPADEAFHTTLGGRRRCDWGTPTEAQRTFASYVLCGRTGYPSGPRAREIAREVLALAGQRTPG